MTIDILGNLPFELFPNIFIYLSNRDVCTFRSLNRTYRNLVDHDPAFWRRELLGETLGDRFFRNLLRGLRGDEQLAALAAAPPSITLRCSKPVYITMDDTISEAMLSEYDARFVELGITFGLSETLLFPRANLPSLVSLSALKLKDCKLMSLSTLSIPPNIKTIDISKNSVLSFAGLETTQLEKIVLHMEMALQLIDGRHLPTTLRSLEVSDNRPLHGKRVKLAHLDRLTQLSCLRLNCDEFYADDVVVLPAHLKTFHVVGDCAEIRFEALPITIRDLTLSGNGLIHDVRLPPHLSRIDLANSSAVWMNREDAFPKSLVAADLSNSNLTSLQSLRKSNIEVLDLSDPMLVTQELRRSFSTTDLTLPFPFRSLRHLHCSFGERLDFSGIAFPETLRELDCKMTQVKHLSDLALPERLVTLRISNTYLYSFEGIERYVWLESLDLSGTHIPNLASVKLPVTLRSLKLARVANETALLNLPTLPASLARLDLSYDHITSLTAINLPPGLKCLSLIGNKLSSLAGVTFPSHLESLNLSENDIRFLTDAAFPASLEVLRMRDAGVVIIAGVTFPPALTRLDLSHNSIMEMRDVTFPRTLHELKLKANCIGALDGERLPPGLLKLDLANNLLTTLGNGMLPPRLKKLNLLKNPLLRLSSAILPPSLVSLDISGIEHCQLDLKAFKSLKDFNNERFAPAIYPRPIFVDELSTD